MPNSRNPRILFFTVIILTAFSTLAYSQTKTTVSKPDLPNAKDTLLSKNWKLQGTEEFGVMNKLRDFQKDDHVTFGLDKKASLKLEGIEKTGTWTADRAKTVINFSLEGTAEKRMYKVLRLVPDTLILEYKDSILVKTKYVFSHPQ